MLSLFFTPPSQEATAENSNSEWSNYLGAEHRDGAWPEHDRASRRVDESSDRFPALKPLRTMPKRKLKDPVVGEQIDIVDNTRQEPIT